MMHPALRVPGSMVLVPSTNMTGRLVQAGQTLDWPRLLHDLNETASRGGVPAIVEAKAEAIYLRLFVGEAHLTLRSSARADAWMIVRLEGLRLHHRRELARRMLPIVARRWLLAHTLRMVPPGSSTWWPQILQAWEAHQQPPDTDTAGYAAFCDQLDTVIEAGRRIKLAKAEAATPVPYWSVESAAAARYSVDSTAVFRLAESGRLSEGDLVELTSPQAPGRVTKLDGDRATVAFRTVVDRRALPQQGTLIVSPNQTIERIQRAAVDALRNGQTCSPGLAAMLAAGQFTAWNRPTTPAVQPREPLDDDQREALQRALTVPDLLLIQGPPGTGKTRTIAEIARAAAMRQERVLICSNANKAVDNALEKLSSELVVVRVGNAEQVDPSVRGLMLPELAGDLRQRISEHVTSRAELASLWQGKRSDGERLLDALATRLDELEARTRRQETLQAEVSALRRTLEAPMRPRLAAAEAELKAAASDADRWSRRLDRLDRRQRLVQRLVSSWLGAPLRAWAQRLAVKHAAMTQQHDKAQGRRAEADRAVATVTAALQAIPDDAQTAAARQQLSAAKVATGECVDSAVAIAQRLRPALYSVGCQIAHPAPDIVGLRQFRAEAASLVPRAKAGSRLLSDWRAKLAEPDVNLYPELLRFADVVGATCIGLGVRRNLVTDLDFDLAIIDEAGQVPLPTALVPMTRAKRTVMVGDHKQLPPVVDSDVEELLRNEPPPGFTGDLTNLLARSAFEQLYLVAPADRKVLLSRQRRMPRVLADFISAGFYEGRLDTAVDRQPFDDLFRSSLAIIDTRDLTESRRHERRRDRSEPWQITGYSNQAEADVIRDLLRWYQREKVEWAVIVPYRAQLRAIKDRLLSLNLPPDEIATHLGTVDAFQGSERDLIIFGFTRSNPAGQVGFLSELRRLNVALTRARRQIVLVGDFGTLTRARDVPFRNLAERLYAHAQAKGQVLAEAEFRNVLSEAWRKL